MKDPDDVAALLNEILQRQWTAYREGQGEAGFAQIRKATMDAYWLGVAAHRDGIVGTAPS